MRTRLALVVALLAPLFALVAAAPASAAPVAPADGAGSGSPWVVTLGDSYISGEAGRWAGNSNVSESRHDALGADAYWDNAANTGEQIERCHRSESAEVYIGVNALNLACSGAKTATYWDDDIFKPGIDFYDDGAGHKGQAKMLQEFAGTHNVKMVTLSIGGNDFNFASIVQSCVVNFLYSPSWWKDYCYDDASVTANFTSSSINARRTAIKNSLLNIRNAMAAAGYSTSQYSIVVQTYPSPIPSSSGFRYSESGYTRQSTGGCGFWNKDANWANATALPTINNTVTSAVTASGLTNVKVLDLSAAMNGRRLCENTVGLVEDKGLATGLSSGAVDKVEWVNQIRTVSTFGSNYYIQESIHPNYWGQLALRNCLRQAYNGGAVRGGACTRSASGLVNGEPRMTLSGS